MNTAIIVTDIASTYGLRRSGHRMTGACPFCGGSAKSDKFSLIIESGGYKCYACGEKGDLVKWLKVRENLSCPDAHEKAGRQCKTPDTCNAADKCRFGTARKSAPQSKRRRQAPTPRTTTNHIKPLPVITDPAYPKLVWTNWAEPFLSKAHELLLTNEAELAYLAGRGIPLEAVERFQLGWHSHVEMIPFSQIGLTPYFDEHTGKEKNKLWVPTGLVIPVFDYGSALHRIRIRRPLSEREKSIRNLKYVWLKGSGKLPYTLIPETKIRGAVIVEAELDAIAIAHAHADVAVIAIGSLPAGIDKNLHTSLNNCPIILIALDAEANSSNAITTWCNEFRHAKAWPTPSGKDAGDFYANGGDLHAWIEAGLPKKAQQHPVSSSKDVKKQENLPQNPVSPAPVQDGQFPSAQAQTGGRGEKNIPGVAVTLSDGSELYVLPEQNADYYALRKEGKRVVTGHDLNHIKVAIATEKEENRLAAANLAIDALEIFGGNCIASRSGEENV